jgi:small subunit ribosomal protein S17
MEREVKLARRTKTGLVKSSKMDKTATVEVVRTVRHEKYNKFVRKSDRYHVHDEKNVCQEGDTVVIVESRPTSRSKRWRLQEIVKKAL